MPSDNHYMKFYHRDFLSSSTVAKMSLAAQGIYIRLLIYQWEDDSLDNNQDILQRLAACTSQEWKQFSPFLDRVFPVCEDGQRRNPRLEAEKQEVQKKRSNPASAENGKKGGRPKTYKEDAGNQGHEDGKPNSEPSEKPKNNLSETYSEPKKTYIPESESESEIKKETPNGVFKKEPGVDDSLFRDLPWWAEKFEEKPDMLASILAKWASEVVWKTGNRAFPDDVIRRDLMLKVAEWLLEFVPDMESLNAELAKLKGHAFRQPRSKQEWVSPDLVLRSCLVKLEPTWRSVKRSRKWDADRDGKSSSPAKGKSAMELLAEKRAQEQAKSAANKLGIDPNSILEAVS